MKYLLVFGLAMVVFWIWRSKRLADSNTHKKAADGRAKPLAAPTEIVACDVCHVHLPRSEALTGPHGVYCSAAHRQQAGH